MNQVFAGWANVADELNRLANSRAIQLNDGQAASLRELAKRLPNNGVIIADEVGMGKTRIAVAVTRCVIAAGGRVAICVPPGLGYQWNDELRKAGVYAPPILRGLLQYFEAWAVKEKEVPWFVESVLVVSHSSANWRLGGASAAWRWALLPEICARWQNKACGNWPQDYVGSLYLDDQWVQRAAESIVGAISTSSENHPTRRLVQEMTHNTLWQDALVAKHYERNGKLRPWLERAVGLGLGEFDLIIVDEAHKSRGQDSGLNRLLNEIVLKSADARCLAMTATPVELDVTQWMQMLRRIQVEEVSKNSVTTQISSYAQAVSKVRLCPNDKAVREKYQDSAVGFKQALDRYLLRRDKREEFAVRVFQKISGMSYSAYRREQEIAIDTTQLSINWKQAVCAAEALSFVTRQSDLTAAKRLRLTIGNGHGIAALIDQLHRDEEDDKKQTLVDAIPEITVDRSAETEQANNKRLQRVQWWQSIMIQPSLDAGSTLFHHPAILAATIEIESVCRRGEKVLVFGRFTRPLRALMQLVNAREMLRCTDGKMHWPQSKVAENEEWGAFLAAHQQLQRPGELNREHLDHVLGEQFQARENQRRKFREKLIGQIEEVFDSALPNRHTQMMFDSFKKAANNDAEISPANRSHSLAVVARAIQGLIGADLESAAPSDFAQAFAELVAAASDRDAGDINSDKQFEEVEANDRWIDLRTRLDEEYSRPEGGFARLMYGETKPETRRFLQLAFNQKQGYPKVLVAQSLVGREGLNLHKACRTVVLLHPEWNPGVVEQQIGRVDRIGSLWEEKLTQFVAAQQVDDGPPTIEIRPVVFKGTYDEKNWQVLRDRWDDLRAQLHGVVISPRIAEKYPDAKEMIAEINDAAPNFSPSRDRYAQSKE
jgi:superfamily II DNA or RNA helicase